MPAPFEVERWRPDDLDCYGSCDAGRRARKLDEVGREQEWTPSRVRQPDTTALIPSRAPHAGLIAASCAMILAFGCEDAAPSTAIGDVVMPGSDATGVDAETDVPPSDVRQCLSAADCPVAPTCSVSLCSGDGRCLVAPRPEGTACASDDPCAASAECLSGTCTVSNRRSGCPCPPLGCGGAGGIDTDGDQCDDTCRIPCSTACDCPGTLTAPDCEGLAPSYECAAGHCVVRCDAPLTETSETCQPCADSAECGAGRYCDRPGCSPTGQCEPRPTSCLPTAAPVCRCDGLTSASACAAAAAGASVAHEGVCECDGPCGPDGAGLCERPTGECGARGVCLERPGSCEPQGDVASDGVCGCGQTSWPSDCERRLAGVAKASDGPCDCPPLVCPPTTYPVIAAPTVPGGLACPTTCTPCPALGCPAGSVPVMDDGATEATVPAGCPNGCAATPCSTSSSDCPVGSECVGTTCDTDAGLCKPIAVTCSANATPVCGCDGVTRASACAARLAGVTVDYDGACIVACGGPLGLECPPGAICDDVTCGDEPGVNSGICAAEGDCGGPVCGCDGTTYATECERRDAGVARAHVGACGCSPLACDAGAIAVDDDGDSCPDRCEALVCSGAVPCPSGAWCEADLGQPVCGGTGRCAPTSVACSAASLPVCGCDGVIHASACAAAIAGVAWQSAPACSPPPTPCARNEDCASNAYCASSTTDLCGSSGTCEPRPGSCDDAPASPVCGCDGRTWDSDCERRRAGVGAATPDACACNGALDCAVDQFCDQPSCDAPGSCAPRPTTCPTGEASPVCGCDGQTWTSACAARAAGTAVGTCDVTCTPGTPDCGPLAYCDGCEGELGICRPRTSACTFTSEPSCGCDGIRYPSDCERAAAGVGEATLARCGCADVPCSVPTIAVDLTGDGCPDACSLCPAIACGDDQSAVDTDADGCVDLCVPKCKTPPTCKGERVLVDSDGDGCVDTCRCGGLPVCAGAQVASDSTGDGCPDTCVCPVPPSCTAAEVPTDHNGDGCIDACRCPAFAGCDAPQVVIDANGDGCVDSCRCPLHECAEGLVSYDADGDGCRDTCACAFIALCGPNATPADSDGDGCAERCECKSVTACGIDRVASDPDGDGCADACLCKTLTCPPGQSPTDTDESGCADTCK
ncbi:MAG: hypothetical protein IV100_26875 [Myxococcales bacterium]|nr:hypothetical protein [Myxococcales bacterium]